MEGNMRRDGGKHHSGRAKPHRPKDADAADASSSNSEMAPPPHADPFAAALATPDGRRDALSQMDIAISRVLAEHAQGDSRFLLERRREPLPPLEYRISGDAMRAAGILEGDRVDVDPRAIAKHGDLVLVSRQQGCFEARWAVVAGFSSKLRGERPATEAIDPAAPGLWTIHGVVRRIVRDF